MDITTELLISKRMSGNTIRCIQHGQTHSGFGFDRSRCLKILIECGATVSHSTLEFIESFSGKMIRIPDGLDTRVVEVNFGVWPALSELVRQDPYYFGRLSDDLGSPSVPVGEIDGQTFDIVLTEVGSVYRICDSHIWFAGSTGLEAIENFCMRAVLPRVPSVGGALIVLPPGCPNTRRLATNAMVQWGAIIENDAISSPLTTRLEIASPSDADWVENVPTEDDVIRSGIVLHRPAIRFLEAYCGIRVVHRNPYLPHYVSWGYLGLCHRSLCGGTPEHQQALHRRREQWGWPVVVGMIDDFNLELSVNEKGEVLLSQFYRPTWRLGSSPEAAIDILLNHKAWEPIPITATF